VRHVGFTVLINSVGHVVNVCHKLHAFADVCTDVFSSHSLHVRIHTPVNVQAVVMLYDNMQNLQSKASVHGTSVVLYFLCCLHIGSARELMIYFLFYIQTTWHSEL
jgi:hypothetical protein